MYKYRTFRPRRTVPLGILLIILGLGVLFFAKNQDALANFKPYYLASYRAAFDYQLAVHSEQAAGTDYAKSVPVLLYHGIIADGGNTSSAEGYSVPVSSFNAQMLALKAAGYHTISINDYYDFIYKGKHLPQKSFVLTFDDGRKDSYYPVQPVLHALGFRATMFVITGHSLGQTSSTFYLSKAELLKMKASGNWDLQAHTRNGHNMFPTSSNSSAPFFANKMWLKDQGRVETNDEYRTRVEQDLEDTKADIVTYLGITPVAWAVPFSDLGENSANYPGAKQALLNVASQIYPIIFHQFTAGMPFSQNYLGSQQEVNVRIEPKPTWTPAFLLQAIHQSDAKSLPYVTTPSSTDGWLTPWGRISEDSAGLHLQATPATTGATGTLDGTYGWADYVTKATVRLLKGSNIRILMRLQDPHHHLECSYTNSVMRLDLVENDKPTLLHQAKVKLDLSKNTLIEATVKGSTATCTAPGGATISARIPDAALTHTGGLGFVVYDGTENNAEGVVTKLEVSMAK